MRYTTCASNEDYDKHAPANWSQDAVWPLLSNALAQAAVLGALGAAIGAVFGLFGIAFLALAFFNYGFVDGFCDQWLNWRLICIRRDTCAMGRVAWIETVDKKFHNEIVPIEFLFDNDLSFNLRLMPFNGRRPGQWEFEKDDHKTVFGLDDIISSGYRAGELLAEGRALGKNYSGYEGSTKPDHPGGRWSMHCEIEGNGMQTLCTIAKVVSVLGPFGQAAGALAGAAIVGYSLARKTFDEVYKRCKKACKIPIFCDIVCVIVAGAAAVAAGFAGLIAGAIVGALPGIGPLAIGALISRFVRHDGQWRDVQNDPESGHIEEGDCVIVAGDEVYDAGHSEGWAEMHPVIHLQKMCAKEEGLTDTADVCCEGALTHSARFMSSEFRNGVNRTWDNWCAAVKAGYKPETIRNQSQPLNSWSVHPLIDGCLPRGEGTAGPVVR